MSPLTRFMTTATAMLDEQNRKAARTDQPPFFVRTTWLFAELEELATPADAETFAAVKICRLRGDIAQVGRLVDQLHASSDRLDGADRHQRQQICGWIKEQIGRETKPCQ